MKTQREIILELLDRLGNMTPDKQMIDCAETLKMSVRELKELIYIRNIEQIGDTQLLRKLKLKKLKGEATPTTIGT